MKDGKIRVLMMVPNLRVSSGVTNFAMNYYRNVDHDKVQIDFVTLSYVDSPYIDEVRSNGSEVYFLGPLLEHPIKHIKLAKKVIKEHDYDIIHDNILLKSLPIMSEAKKKAVPIRILHSHNPFFSDNKTKNLINKLMYPLLVRKATHFAACSSSAGKTLFGNKEFSIIPNIIDTDVFAFDDNAREEVRATEGNKSKYIVGTVGRLAPQKNPFFAIDVMEEVLRRRQDVEYWWIGSGELDDKVKKYVEEKRLSDRIFLFGSRSDISRLYQGMDVFFLPSVFEGFGMACIEAESSGLPCVVSSNFPSEVNISGDVEFIPLDKGIDYWASAIIESLNKQNDRANANEILRESCFSRSGSGSMLTDFYESLLKAGENG